MDIVKITYLFIIILIFLIGCLSNENDKPQNSIEIRIDLIEDHFENDDFILNNYYQVRLNFTNIEIDSINLSLEDFKLITKSKNYVADKSPNIPDSINQSETKNFVISFDVDEDEEYENLNKIVYELNTYGLYYEIKIPK
ncbi:MAG: hypothetical protein JSV09_14475 [Thermoplasmata archaeon]|nr:MAG: hypothetical protein JSV09_14475 [Thermoplasmata archaeon]